MLREFIIILFNVQTDKNTAKIKILSFFVH